MRNNKLIIGIIVFIAFIGFILAAKAIFSAGKGKKAAPAAQAKSDLGKKPAKKAISKGKGAITVKTMNFKSADIPLKIKIFKMADQESSVYVASTVGGRMQELLPGTYDIEVDTVPQRIFKNIRVNENKETIKNLGCVTGALSVKTINAKKALAYFPLRVMYGKTNEMVTASMTNKILEISPGTYDIEIGTSPRQYKKDIKVEAGKESVVDLGCITGTLIVKTTDDNKRDVRCAIRVTRSDTNEIVSSSMSNKPIELGKGKYNVDLMVSPKQTKKDIVVNIGEESVAEVTVTAPMVPQKSAASMTKPQTPRPQPVNAVPVKTKQ